jgi:hypothetical protein
MPSTTSDSKEPAAPAAAPLPWWRYRIVWLVFGLPSSAVVASLLTFGIAWHGADVPLRELARADAARTTSLQPAVQARNHAATPR